MNYGEERLNHEVGEAERFYKGVRVRVGMEATGYARWIDRLLAELDFELWIGDPAEIEAPNKPGIRLPSAPSASERFF